MISAIIPTLNEVEYGFFTLVLERLNQFPEIEVIAVDGGSQDGTLSLLKNSPVKLLSYPKVGLVDRLNQGISKATGSLILLQHPQCLIEEEGLAYLLDHEEELSWGGFRYRSEVKNPVHDFEAWYGNEVMGKRRGLLGYEHCPFFQKSSMDKESLIPTSGYEEGFSLSLKLSKMGKPQILPFFSTLASASKSGSLNVTDTVTQQIKKLSHLLSTEATKRTRTYWPKISEHLKELSEKVKKKD